MRERYPPAPSPRAIPPIPPLALARGALRLTATRPRRCAHVHVRRRLCHDAIALGRTSASRTTSLERLWTITVWRSALYPMAYIPRLQP
jgi:hypothetical protein